MTGPATTDALVAALDREPIELADGVTPEEVMRLALNGIDIAYRAHGESARVSLLAVQADWIMQHLAKTEAWAKDEQAKRHAAEDKLVEARSRAALAEVAHQQVAAERDEARAENDRFRAGLANGAGPCTYCNLSREDWTKCRSGFPGCDRADDAMLCPHFGAEMEANDRADTAASELARLRAALTKIANGETEILDEGLGCNISAWLTDDEMQDIARTALARAATAREG